MMDTYTIKEKEIKAIQLKSDNTEEVTEVLRSISQDYTYSTRVNCSVTIKVGESYESGYLGDYLLKKDKKVYIISKRAFEELYVGRPTKSEIKKALNTLKTFCDLEKCSTCPLENNCGKDIDTWKDCELEKKEYE